MSLENIYNWTLFISSVPLPTAHTNPVTQNGYGSFLIVTWKSQRFLLHQDRFYSQWDETALGDANVEISLARNVSVRGASSSASALCEQPPRPFAVGDLLKWEPIRGVPAHAVWGNIHDCPLARNLERLFPLCLLRLAIWKYLLTIKNEKSAF